MLSRLAYRRYFENKPEFVLLGDFQDATSCIEEMKKNPSDIVIMDLELSGLNGIEATKIIKEKFPKTKVIIATIYKNEEKIIASLASGACGYVIKNKNFQLEKIINNIMNGGFWMDLEIARLAFSQIPTPNINDLENLYENKKLKNNLTQRELEVLKLLTDGKTNSQIAKEIIISTNTAKAHVGNILTKLEVKDRVQAAVKAVRAKLF